MAHPTYRARGIVVRKTKLGEMDLIVTFLASDGSQMRAVTKGARKPGGALAGKIEIANTVDVLCSVGRSLDTVKEARLSASYPSFRSDVEKAACAACIAELCERVTQVDLPHARLFDMIEAAFRTLDRAQGAVVFSCTAAVLLKLFAFTGVAPQLSHCAVCGGPLNADASRTPFSVEEGGSVCVSCADTVSAWPVDTATVQVASALLRATFDAFVAAGDQGMRARAVLELCRDWSRFHVGSRIRSLDFLLDGNAGIAW